MGRLEACEAKLGGHRLAGDAQLGSWLAALQHKRALTAAARAARREIKDAQARARRAHAAGELGGRCCPGSWEQGATLRQPRASQPSPAQEPPLPHPAVLHCAGTGAG